MKIYRTYAFDKSDQVISPPALIFCDTDGQAAEKAALAGEQIVELRDGGRVVKRIELERPDDRE
jgi:hypothetical protein